MSRYAMPLVLATLVLAACGEGTTTAPIAPPKGEVIEYAGQRYYLDGAVLRDARGRKLARMSTQILEGMRAAIDAPKHIEELRTVFLETSAARAAIARALLRRGVQAAGDANKDWCDDAFMSLYQQTTEYTEARDAYWRVYFDLISLGWNGDFETPDVFDVTGLIAQGIDIIVRRTALDFLATQIRLNDCLNYKRENR